MNRSGTLVSPENTHFMNSWGTYGIRLSSILDRLGWMTAAVKYALLQGFIVEGLDGARLINRATPLAKIAVRESFFVIFGGTLLATNVRRPHARGSGATIQRGCIIPNAWTWKLDRVSESVLEDDAIDSWLDRVDLPSMETPIGLPWEIARITDPVARLSAIQAYKANCV